MLETRTTPEGILVSTEKLYMPVAMIYYRNDQWEIEFESSDHSHFNVGLADLKAAEYYVLAIYLHQVASGY